MHLTNRVTYIMLVLLLFSAGGYAQLFPGMRVNGRIVAQGDTVYVCKGSTLNYVATATGYTSIDWRFDLGTPATANTAGAHNVTYNTTGIDSTVQVIRNGLLRDSMFIIVRVSDEKPVTNFSFAPDDVCGNIPIQFTNLSTGLRNSYQWDFTDGVRSNATSPAHQFLNAIGTSGSQVYNVKLVATNFYGCKDSVTQPVTIRKIPDASIGNADPGVTFTAFNSTFKVCTNTPSYTYQFINNSSTISNNVTYTIKWGDGTLDTSFTSWPTGSIIQHTYTIGSREMTVEVTGPSGCIGIKKYTVFLGTNPAGGFNSLGNTNVCTPDSLAFVISGTQNNAPGTIYTVSVNDGSVPQVFTHPPPDTVVHTFLYSSCNNTSSNGTLLFPNSFNATLTIENPCDLTSVSVIPIYVSGKPRPSIRVAPGTSVCTGSAAYILSTSSYGGVVVPLGGGNSSCDNVGKQVWKIEPATGYTITNGNLGSLNNNPLNGFIWTNGDQQLEVFFNTTGTYRATIYVFNERCGMDSTTREICVRLPPAADFTMSSREACGSATVAITNTSPPGLCLGDSYTWQVSYLDPLGCGNGGTPYAFINGTSSTSANPELSFSATGKYAISLTVGQAISPSNCVPATKTDTFVVKGKPKAAITPIGDICVGSSISPTATMSPCYATTALQYSWTFTNGSPASAAVEIPGSVSYTLTGSFPVALKVTSECGDTTVNTTVNVIEPPVAVAGNDTTVCQHSDPLLFTALPVGGGWSGNPFVDASGNFRPTTSGTYPLVYTYSAGACSDTDTLFVTVKDGITNNLIQPDQTICTGTQPATITGQVATGGDGTPAYQWQESIDGISWSDINTATGLDYTPPVLTTSTYYRRVAFTTLCSGTRGSFSTPVLISVKENANADFSTTSTLGCIPYVLGNVLTVTPYPDRNGQYSWYADGQLFGANNTGVFPGFTMNTADDTVLIKLVVNSPFGCLPDSQEVQFITAAGSTARFTKNNGGGCGPVTVDFRNVSSNFRNIQFFWDFGNGQQSTNAQPGPVTFLSSPVFSDTTYYVTLKAFNGCDTTYWYDSIRVLAPPSARFGVVSTFGCSPFTVQISNNSLGAASTYYWDFGNGQKDTTFRTGSLNYTYNIGNLVDTFTITLIAVNGCGADTQTLDIRIAPNIIRPLVNVNGSDLFGCAPHTVQFINATSGATRYTWDFGDGSAPLITANTDVVVSHTYADSGTFTIRIQMTNGCSDTTAIRHVTVYRKPFADFRIPAAVYCEGDTVRVINQSADANSFVWLWGDGQSSTGANPVHIYNSSGSFRIYLRAERTNSSGLVCFDTTEQFVTVLAIPDTRLQTNLRTVNCAPFTLDASAAGLTNENSTWYIYDSTVSNPLIIRTGTNSVQYTYNRAGTFYVKVVAVNAQGCADSTEVRFTVWGTPEAAFTPGNGSTCSLDTSISFLNNSQAGDNSGLSYRWFVDNLQRATSGNFTHRFTAPANALLPLSFTTLLIATNAVGCSDTASAVLQMNPKPRAAFTLNNPQACVPYQASLTNNTLYTTRYQWFLNGVLTDTTANPVITIPEAQTNYRILLVAGNDYGCGSDSLSVSFTSRIKPIAAFSLSDTIGCTGVLNIATNNSSRFANAYSWNWGDNSAGSFLTNPTHLYNVQGQYRVTLVASDGVCRDTADQLVRVSVKPVVRFAVSDSLTCDTARVQFINLSEGASNYRWSFSDGGSSNEVAPFRSFAPSQTPYSVKLVADNGLGCRDSLTRANLITAKVPPVADFFISPSPVITVPKYSFSFNNLSTNSNRYFYNWNLGDGTFSTERDIASHKYSDTGSYPVQLIVFDTLTNCADTIIRIARVDGFPGFLYVPNAICPGCLQTGLREFMPKGKGLAVYRLQIFTTWGELIFETSALDADGAPSQAWDGRYKGQLVQQDVYVWRIDAKFQNGTEWLGMLYPGEAQYKKVGTITVVK